MSNHTATTLPSTTIICVFSPKYITDCDGKIIIVATYSLSSISFIIIIATVIYAYARFWPCANCRASQTHLINPCLMICLV